MPIEFSVACYRFGHSMIRNGYDYNRNFGGKPDGSPGFRRAFASLSLLFLFTGKAGRAVRRRHTRCLPHNWIIEWDRFDGSTRPPGRSARKIDTHLAPTLLDLPNEGEQTPASTTGSRSCSSSWPGATCDAAISCRCRPGRPWRSFRRPALSQVEIGQNGDRP